MAGSVNFDANNKPKFLKENSDTERMTKGAITLAGGLGLSTSGNSIIRAIGFMGVVVGSVDLYKGYHGS